MQGDAFFNFFSCITTFSRPPKTQQREQVAGGHEIEPSFQIFGAEVVFEGIQSVNQKTGLRSSASLNEALIESSSLNCLTTKARIVNNGQPSII